MSFSIKAKPIAIAVLAALGGTGAAQGAEPTPLALSQTERALSGITVTADGHHEPQLERKNSGHQKIVVGEEEVERYGDATVGDVLRRLPGMTFTGPAGTPKDVRMRGLDKGYTLFLINGEPVSGAAQERQMQVDRLPADMIERIEIVRNPMAEHDTGGIGGTVNIVLKQRAENLTRLRAAYGKNGHLDVGDAIGQWSRRFDQLDVVLALSHTVGAEDIVEDKKTLNVSGNVTQREHKPKPVKKSETLLTPRLAWTVGQHRLILEPFLSVGSEAKRESSELRNAAATVIKRLTNTEDKTDQLARVAGRYESTSSWGTWHGKLALQQGKSGKDKSASESTSAGVVNKRTEELENIQEDQAFAGAGAALALGKHVVKLGAEWRETRYDKRKTTLEAGNASAPLLAKAPGANDIYHIDETKSTVYFQDEWHVADAHWLTPGLRYEHTRRVATDRNAASRFGSQASPNPSLHYRWAASKDTNLRASVARTLKLPKFDDLNPLVSLASGAGAGGATNPDKGGNANLRPERAAGVEIGVEQFFWGNRGVVGLNVYHRSVDDFVQKATRLEGSRYIERPENAASARFWGAELDWRLPLLRKGAHELTITGSHAQMRGDVRNAKTGRSGDIKDLAPQLSNIGVDWRHLPSKWSAGFAVNYVPGFSTDGLNADGAREVKTRNSSALLDLYLTKVFSAKAELRLVAKNVLSVQKVESTTKYQANGSFSAAEAKTETSAPTVFLTFESRF
ncbi:TonB-dependent receptor plug domain-containing protein [Rhodoferax sp.]|uniref:TonB-dependent receptor plug domain-containing protein n=1 Tax=Rhodoferax sp. TaxID=50421 RepID=UPI0027752C42|nr:TonB-dependent receptor [Rhodoferax sp.]